MIPNAVVSLMLALFLSLLVAVATLLKRRYLILICLSLMIMTWMFRSQIACLQSDMPFHYSLTRHVLETGMWFSPGDPFFVGVPTPLHFSLLHQIAAVLAHHFTVTDAWGIIACASILLAMLAAQCLAARVLKSPLQVSAATVFCGVDVALSAYIPGFSTMSRFVLWIAFSLVIGYVSDPQRPPQLKDAIVSGVLCGLAVAIRLFTGALGFIALLVLHIVVSRLLPVRGRIKYLACFTIFAVLVSAPWLVNPFSQGSLHSTSRVLQAPAALGYVASRVKAFVILSPSEPGYWQWWVWVFLSCCGVMIVLFGFCKRIINNEGIRVLVLTYIAMFLFPWCIVLRMLGVGEYTIFRFQDLLVRILAMIPIWLVVLVPILCLLRWAHTCRLTLAKVALGVAGLLTLAILCFPAACRMRLKFEYGRDTPERFAYIYDGKEAELACLKGDTVLSDAWTSYMIQHQLGFRCVTTPVGHSSALVDVTSRSDFIKRLFSGELESSEVAGVLEEMACDWVLINVPLAQGKRMPHFGREPFEYSNYDLTFASNYRCLKEVIVDDGIQLYAVDRCALRKTD